MKKIILNFLSVIIFTISFQTSRANSHFYNDSILPRPVNLISDNLHPSKFLSVTRSKDKNESELQKFIFSAAVTPRFKTTIPPVNVYFEHGISGLASLGVSFGALYDRQSELDYHAATISLGVRGCGYALPVISKISGNAINGFGFQPYLGLVYDYYITAISIGDNDIDPVTSSNFGICAGTRWYPGKGKFGLLGEFNSNGLGSNIRFGISLGR